MLRHLRTLLVAVAALTCQIGAGPARADEPFLRTYWPGAFDNFCSGECKFKVFFGPRLDTAMADTFGFKGKVVGPWEYRYGNSTFLGSAVSRRFLSLGGLIDIEPEIGVGQRFGSLDEQEFWGAVYFRWVYFPWNDTIRTSFALSTGINYATGNPKWEQNRSQTKHGSQWMHYLSPEITLGLPGSPFDLMIRLHHRSGGVDIWGYTPLFKGTSGGAQYLTVGMQYRF